MAKPRVPRKVNEETAVTPVEAASTPLPEAKFNGADAKTNGEAKSESKHFTKKPSIVRSEVRANIVPINVDEEIRRLAYLLSERRGFEPGHETEDWLAAEREVRQRYHQHSA